MSYTPDFREEPFFWRAAEGRAGWLDGEHSWQHTAAILRVVHASGWPWRLAWLAWLVPAPLRDAAYRAIARRRYRLFGRSEACLMPPPAVRARFLD